MAWPSGPLPSLVAIGLLAIGLIAIGLLAWHLWFVRRWLTRTPDGLLHQLREREERIAAAEAIFRARLEEVASLSTEQARTRVRAMAIEQAAERVANDAEDHARDILLSAVSRLTLRPGDLRFATTVELPDSSQLRSRLIGSGGQNVQAFERVTGAELSLRNSGSTATVVAFNAYTRHVAVLTLRELLTQDRITPPVIESIYEEVARGLVPRTIQRARDAAHALGILDLPDPLLLRLGQLETHWRSGRDLLHRSVVGAQAADLLARELGIDSVDVRRAALLRDIGQTASRKEDGPHGSAGARLALENGESTEVCRAIRDHHLNPASAPVLSVLVSASDRIVSRIAARYPRFEPAHQSSQRLRRMQEMCEQEPCVARADVLKAGEEIRVLVHPHGIPEGQELALALRLTQQIRAEWQISVSVTVVRQTSANAESA